MSDLQRRAGGLVNAVDIQIRKTIISPESVRRRQESEQYAHAR